MKFRILIILSLLCAFIACSPRISLNGASIPEEAKTVSVGFFTNNTTLGAPSLSQRFTERLKDAVSQQTRLALVKQAGDIQFEGYISDYVVSPISVQNDQASQNRLTISVNVKFVNKYDPAKNFERAFTRFADFPSTRTISSVEAELVAEIYRQITEDIFTSAFNNW